MIYAFINDNFVPFNLIKFRIISDSNIANFVESVCRVDFSEVLNSEDCNVASSIFYEKFFNLYNNSFPIKKKKIRKNYLHAP